jgi:hypothetical protein
MTKCCFDTFFGLLDSSICETDDLKPWEGSVAITFTDDLISIESLVGIGFDERGHIAVESIR